MIFVKPKEGLNIRHPAKVVYILPAEGCWVENTTAIKRLIRDGDLEVIDKPTTSETKGKRKKAAATEGDN
jgi:hypothetical protein